MGINLREFLFRRIAELERIQTGMHREVEITELLDLNIRILKKVYPDGLWASEDRVEGINLQH